MQLSKNQQLAGCRSDLRPRQRQRPADVCDRPQMGAGQTFRTDKDAGQGPQGRIELRERCTCNEDIAAIKSTPTEAAIKD